MRNPPLRHIVLNRGLSFCCRRAPKSLCSKRLQRISLLTFAKTPKRTVTKLTDPLARDPQHVSDLLECVFPFTLETEVQTENLRITGFQC
jgi:hypothetical protein